MVALFAFFVCFALQAPWYYYAIGLLCLSVDS